MYVQEKFIDVMLLTNVKCLTVDHYTSIIIQPDFLTANTKKII